MTERAESDQQLMMRLRGQDACAFETLFDRYRQVVYAQLARMVREPNTAEDLTQEVFLRVWNHAEQWTGQGAFRSWLLRIAANVALNHLRSVKRRREQPLDFPVETVAPGAAFEPIDANARDPEEEAERTETARRIQELVEGLPEEKRAVFRLAHDADMAVREIALQLGIPEGTVRSRLHYARKHLAREWEQLAVEGRKPR